MIEVTFTDAAIDDLRRIGPDAVPKVLRKVLILLDSPDAGYPLGGELTGFRKLVVGRNAWRIVYRVVDEKQVEICEVWAVGARADAEVYAQATARVRAASGQRLEISKLADVPLVRTLPVTTMRPAPTRVDDGLRGSPLGARLMTRSNPSG